MKKKYVTPEFQEISLYMEGEIALNVSSDPDKKIDNESQILSNKKSGGWDSSLWSSNEETTPNE